jgi:hypothetical protein
VGRVERVRRWSAGYPVASARPTVLPLFVFSDLGEFPVDTRRPDAFDPLAAPDPWPDKLFEGSMTGSNTRCRF